jgi:ATP-dependent RNA helicase DDX3X
LEPRKNSLGFHGSLQEDAFLERRLFKGVSCTGINFDKVCGEGGGRSMIPTVFGCSRSSSAQYDDIPVEVSGDDVPEPVTAFDSAVMGAAISRNLALCGYTKPTPVQKYSIPIGTSPLHARFPRQVS